MYSQSVHGSSCDNQSVFYLYALATQPDVSNPKISEKKVKDRGFAIAPDGRFIIRDDNEKNDSDTEGKNKKSKTSFLQSDSEDDYSKYFV